MVIGSRMAAQSVDAECPRWWEAICTGIALRDRG